MANDIEQQLEEAAQRAESASTAFYNVLTFDKDTPVPVESGVVDSMSKRIYDQVATNVDAIETAANTATDAASEAQGFAEDAAESATAAQNTRFAEVVDVADLSLAIPQSNVVRYFRFTAGGDKNAFFSSTQGFIRGQEYNITNRAQNGDLTLSSTGVTLNAPKGGTLILEPKDTVTVKFISGADADVMGSTKGIA